MGLLLPILSRICEPVFLHGGSDEENHPADVEGEKFQTKKTDFWDLKGES